MFIFVDNLHYFYRCEKAPLNIFIYGNFIYSFIFYLKQSQISFNALDDYFPAYIHTQYITNKITIHR